MFKKNYVLKAKRVSLGLNQKQLAKKSGLSLSTIAWIESGRVKNPNLDTINKISKALNVDAKDIFDIEEEQKGGSA